MGKNLKFYATFDEYRRIPFGGLLIQSAQQLAGISLFSSWGEVEVASNILFAPRGALVLGLDTVGSVLAEEGRKDAVVRLHRLQIGLAGAEAGSPAEAELRRDLLRTFYGIQGWPAVAQRISAQAIIANGSQSSRRPSLAVVPPSPSVPTDRVAEIFSKLPPRLVAIWRDFPPHRPLFQTSPAQWTPEVCNHFAKLLGHYFRVCFYEWGIAFLSTNPILYARDAVAPVLIDLLRALPLPSDLASVFDEAFLCGISGRSWWLLPKLSGESEPDRIFRIFELLKSLEEAACMSSLFRNFLSDHLYSLVRMGRRWNSEEFILELADHFFKQYQKIITPDRWRNISHVDRADIQKESQAILNLLRKWGEGPYRKFEAVLRGRFIYRNPLDALDRMASGLI